MALEFQSARSPLRPGRILLTLVAILTSCGAFVADWDETHIYNPTWPGHAKFHNGQTMSMGLLLGLSTLYYLYTPITISESKGNSNVLVKRELAKANIDTSALLASLYWVTQLMAWFYPGSKPADPPQDAEMFKQGYLCTVLLMVVGMGWLLEKRRIAKIEERS